MTESTSCSSWTFSLRIPPNIHKGTKSTTVSISPPPEVVQLVARLETSVPSLPITTKAENDTKRTLRVASTASTSSSSNFDTTETEKLLHQPQPQPHQSQHSCWSLTASAGAAIGVGATPTPTTTTTPTMEQVQLGLESHSLLQLVYRPAWQGLPEYTQRSSKLVSLLTSCCNGNQDYRIPGPQQVADLYTTQDIVDYEILDHPKQPLVIRGIGPCQALRVYLHPHYYYNSDEDGHNILNNAGTGSARLPPMPDYYQDAMMAHLKRMGLSSRSTSLTESSSTWSRFSEPRDSLHPSNSDDDGNDDRSRSRRRRQCIVITFAMPLLTSADAEDSTTGSPSPSAPPPLLWKVDLPPPPSRNDSLIIDSITVLDGKLQQPSSSNPPTHVYINGYQSWSFAGSVAKGERQPQSAMPNMFSGAFNQGGTLPLEKATTQWFGRRENDNATTTTESSSTYYHSNFFTCITTAGQASEQKRDGKGPMLTSDNANNNAEGIVLDENGGPAIVLGWLSQHEQFGVLRISQDLTQVEMHASHKGLLLGGDGGGSTSIVTDWAYGQLLTPDGGSGRLSSHQYDEEPMAHYVEAVAAHHQTSPLHNGPILTGWCSWYHYYENINASNIRNNVSQLAELKNRVFPTNLVMVDDGYMTAWGDWDSFPPNKFDDMSIVARDIRAQGMKPGIWLAPFACDKHSKTVSSHPTWIIRNDQGRPANSSNCGKFFFGLDATNPEVLEHVTKSIRRAVHEWGFEVLKIDFLYAACLEGNGKYDLRMSRSQAMHQAMQTIRQAAGPNVFLIGCGCPLGSGIGYVDGMRVSADTGPSWYPALPLPWWDHGGTLPAVRAMVRNTLCRSPLGHRWWHNDPDCLLIRESTALTTREVISAATVVAMSGGMMLLSDDLAMVSAARLDIVIKMYPLTGATGIVLDLHNNNHPHSLPQLVRLWCTDQYYELLLEDYSMKNQNAVPDCNDKATYFAQHASFQYSGHKGDPTLSKLTAESFPPRQRSCVHVCPGLGTWTVISLSNWADKAQILEVPPAAFVNAIPAHLTTTTNKFTKTAPHGYHVFAFWTSRYSWLAHPDDASSPSAITKLLGPHETEVFHIKPVTPDQPQYVGSDLHFSCGVEVVSFGPSGKHKNQVQLLLKTTVERAGNCFLYIPVVDTRHVRVTVAGQPARRWTVVGNVPLQSRPSRACGRILRISVDINPSGNNFQEGQVVVDY